tara:strand:- start:514 stop:888 length:375 start_codon:yes stop_codon:yes gene_type:complete
MKYNFDYKLNYRENFANKDTSDTIYRKDIIAVFNMDFNVEDDFFKKLSDKVNDIYKELENHIQIVKILNKIEESINLPFKLKSDVLFLYLFRYDLFFLFHKCLQDFNIYAEISNDNLKLLLENI